MEPEFFKFIKNDNTFLEREPLEKVAKKNELAALDMKDFGSAWIQKEIKIISLKF